MNLLDAKAHAVNFVPTHLITSCRCQLVNFCQIDANANAGSLQLWGSELISHAASASEESFARLLIATMFRLHW